VWKGAKLGARDTWEVENAQMTDSKIQAARKLLASGTPTKEVAQT
jgi:hypothetical protein